MVTADTNVAVYALTSDAQKARRAQASLIGSDFLSVQVLNETANVLNRKRRLVWDDILDRLSDLRELVPDIRTITDADNRAATRLAQRYRLQFYDALLIAVALANGATTLYSEDMQHGLLIDDTLRIKNPFRDGEVIA